MLITTISTPEFASCQTRTTPMAYSLVRYDCHTLRNSRVDKRTDRFPFQSNLLIYATLVCTIWWGRLVNS
jgi:hypothetical protein